MYCVELHEGVKQIFEIFYRFGLWSRGEQATVTERRIKLFYSIYYLLFPISLLAGAIKSDNSDESILLLETSIIAVVMSIKLQYIIWKQNEIKELSHRIGFYSVDNHEEFTFVNRRLNTFMKVTTYFFFLCIVVASTAAVVVPIVGSERILFLNIGFPFDWKNNEIAYWIAFVFFTTEMIITALNILFSITMWYLLFNISLNYKVLGSQLRNMGVIKKVDATTVSKVNISEVEKENAFLRDLIAGIESHKNINEYNDFSSQLTYLKTLLIYSSSTCSIIFDIFIFIRSTQQLESFLSFVFSVQLATSAVCICTSIYCLAYVILIFSFKQLIISIITCRMIPRI